MPNSNLSKPQKQIAQNRPEKLLYQQLRALSVIEGTPWKLFSEPERNAVLFDNVSCAFCGKWGRRNCKVCKGKGTYPRFEADFYWRDANFAVEVQGGTWKMGGHSSGKGIQRDIRKLQLCLLHDIQLLQVTTEDVESGIAFRVIMWKL